jgi:hypothetical protein
MGITELLCVTNLTRDWICTVVMNKLFHAAFFWKANMSNHEKYSTKEHADLFYTKIFFLYMSKTMKIGHYNTPTWKSKICIQKTVQPPFSIWRHG